MFASTDHVDGLDSNMSAKIATCQCEASSMYSMHVLAFRLFTKVISVKRYVGQRVYI